MQRKLPLSYWQAQRSAPASLLNRKRRHSTLGYKSPAQFLQNWISTQREEKLVA
jgi:transposase InsO family protein